MRPPFLALVISVAIVTPAHAVGTESGAALNHYGETEIVVWIDEPATPSSSPANEHNARRLPRLAIYSWTPANSTNTNGTESLCDAGDGSFGWYYTLYTYDRTGTLISEKPRCVPLPDPNNPSQRPVAPPTPLAPTLDTVWKSAKIPEPQLRINPASRGITGLESWFWFDDDRTRTVAVNLDGYTVTGTAHLVGYTIDTGENIVDATEPGTEQTPAARHTYATKGTYTLTVTARWQAEATMTAPGITTPVTVDLGTATITTTHPYQVNEIVPELTG